MVAERASRFGYAGLEGPHPGPVIRDRRLLRRLGLGVGKTLPSNEGNKKGGHKFIAETAGGLAITPEDHCGIAEAMRISCEVLQSGGQATMSSNG